ncbi:hypothetical protein IQ266_17875 [filamentous cyanobacterium LEGE 11480]|uniref:Uncharacterized protein n=1 Tax=Romeriopsis navalis LEGE 11480 TaxID=2777977 RepID=A0A928VNK1_9CYAN|nr:hypothetical protein [Romeriopsis navalis]MBE9031605.1 hypothetical protein [Romeriopsis navalis LEGE 11480]
MAAPITTTATTLEAQLFEVAQALEEAERAYNLANPNTPVNGISVALDPEAGSMSLTATVAATSSGTAGTISLTPDVYIPA